ncbi:hypothetical protein GQ53DRAFT_810885 [Thozetella sp. PMI_491]|nr:hypothetical protein GQ53DRAFT_810885 [Thozetella sp. PMI_491]
MAAPDPPSSDDRDLDQQFLEHAYLTYILPFATDFKLEKDLGHADEPAQSLFDSIEQREWLFFDETVDVYLILRAPYAEEHILGSCFRRLSITLEAQVVNSHAPDRDSPPAQETIYTGTVKDLEDPFVLVDETDAGTDTEESGISGGRIRYVYAIWKLPVFLARPRIRLQSPYVIFLASASFRPPELGRPGLLQNGYLQSRAPPGMNLLESFSLDPALGGIKPRLSAMRVSRVAPVSQSKEQAWPIEGLQSLKLKVYPVVHTRVRFSRPNLSPPSPALIALLEVDFTPFFDCEVTLNDISLAINNGTVEDLNVQEGMGLPLRCVAHDHVTFLYRLAPEQLDVVSKSPARDLEITIDVTAFVRPDGPHACMPKLSMSWTTALDFTLPVNPGFGQPITQPMQRSHRPSQLSIGGGADAQSLVSPSVIRPDALPSLEAATRPVEATLPEFGITMTFTGPDKAVRIGEEFAWSVFVVNRSKPDAAGSHPAAVPALSRKLALVVIPKRRRNDLRVMRPPSTAGAGSKRDPLVADAVLDENVVHAMQRSSVVDNTDIVCLSADVRVGPLAPNACAVVQLRFLALQGGIVGIEAVRVVDLTSQEHVDVRDLPVVVVGGKDD